MKKNLFLLFCTFCLALSAFGATKYDAESKLETIGQNLLTKNGITAANIKFEATSKTVDNSTFALDKIISISKDELSYALNDNEVAAVIANELGHIITGHGAKDKLISSVMGADTTTNTPASSLVNNIAQTKKEKEADVIAVNLMANADYNPLSAIVVLTRQTQTSWNAIMGKPANADRAMNIYDYTAFAYPEKFKAGYSCNEYKNFLTYANTVLEERKTNKKLNNKVQKEVEKERKNSVKTISSFKTRGAVSGWDAAYSLLNGETK